MCCGVLQVLLEYQGQKLGLLEVESRWTPDKAYETLKAYGTSALEHPGMCRVDARMGLLKNGSLLPC